jgi:hypothetical protein
MCPLPTLDPLKLHKTLPVPPNKLITYPLHLPLHTIKDLIRDSSIHGTVPSLTMKIMRFTKVRNFSALHPVGGDSFARKLPVTPA